MASAVTAVLRIKQIHQAFGGFLDAGADIDGSGFAGF
jgi:hypothetical protein